MMQLGGTLKKIRKQQGLSQKEVCEDICAQSMLSAIEHDRYVPNAELLIKLCRRLSISLDAFSLAANFDISASQQFNQTVETLCNGHEYQKLKAFLLAPATVEQVETAAQTQAYYYYLGVAQFQTDSNLDVAQVNLRLAIQSAPEKNHLSTLTRLSLISLAVVKCTNQQPAATVKLVHQAMQDIELAPYEENLNIIFYLAAFIAYETDGSTSAFTDVNRTIDFITAHNSHYMLANCYRLIAQIAMDQGDDDRQLEATQRQKFLTDLFHEHVQEHF